MAESECELVSSRGILKQCDVHPRSPHSGTRQLLNYDWSRLRPGCSIYVGSASLMTFLQSVFPRIPFRFHLVTGDCDLSVPTQVIPTPVLDMLLKDERLIGWWSQNLILPRRHPKLRPLPIGLDYHTMAAGNHDWGKQMTPLEQEALLKQIRDGAKPIGERRCQLHSNFHFAFGGRQFAFDRHDAIAKIPAELIYYEPDATDRETTWRHQAEYAFVASPMGGGLDCHRTWEALALGCIPVMRSGPLDPLFEGLPVRLVKRWDDLSAELLETTLRNSVARWDSFEWNRLHLNYWMTRINSSE